MNIATNRRIRLAVGLVVTVLFIYLFLNHVELDQLVAAATQVHLSALTVGLVLLIFEYGLRVVRWWLMLRACVPDIAVRACISPLVVSVAVNNLVPLRAGDAFRVIGFGEQLKASPVQLLGTLIIERLLDVTILLLFLLAGLATLSESGSGALYGKIAVTLFCAAVLGWVVLLTAGEWLQRALLWMCRTRPLTTFGWGQVAEPYVRQFTAALALMHTPRGALQLLTVSALVWGCNGAIFATVAHELGYHGAFYGPWFSLSTATLATLIPSSPGYVGAFDYFAMSGLMVYGASRALAALFALVVHIVLWLPTTVAGLIYLLLPSSQLRRRALIQQSMAIDRDERGGSGSRSPP